MATILLAEDNEAVRLLTQAKLRHQFTVVTAANGREALDILNRQHVDLIVADVMMPVMDGYQLVRTLRAEGNEIPVLFLTALQSMDSKREGFSSGIDDYLTKPVDYEELIWRIPGPAAAGPHRQRTADPCGKHPTGFRILHRDLPRADPGAAKEGI